LPDPALIFRRVTGRRQHDDYDVFDGDRDVGRIYFVEVGSGDGRWFWNVSFEITGRKSFGHAATLDEAKGRVQGRA
jgi:hypothetical protein